MKKKIIITVVSIFVVLIAALIILPIFFKGDILRYVQTEASKSLKANLHIGDVSLSMFKSFPALNVQLEDITLTGKGELEQDTLINIPLFEASVNIKSLLSGNKIIINKILLKDCDFTPTITATGACNWDIMLDDDTSEVKEVATTTESEDKSIAFNDIEIKNLYIDYNDYKASNYASVAEIDLKLSGDLSETDTILELLLDLKNISFRTGNSVLVNNMNLSWDTEIAANLKEMLFNIKKSDLALNDLKLDLTGSVDMNNDKYLVDLLVNAPDTKFESLLALVPKDYQDKIKGLKTAGDFNFKINAKGEYYENHLPALNILLAVNNASVKYPELPESINNINLDLAISNPGGAIDLTIIDLSKMSFSIANNPFSMHAKIINPNDPLISGGANGTINFENLKKAIPLNDMTLNGIITTDVTFDGKYQYIEKEQYEKFTAKGTITLKDILFVTKDYPKGISVPSGNIVITPAKLNLNNIIAKVNSSDFSLQGNISNYLPYIFKNEMLKGNFTLNSNLINLNEFMTSSATPADTTTTKTSAAEGAIEIPKNIDIKFAANVKSILFDNLIISNTKGNVTLANAAATLGNLSMNMLKGSMVINGKYNTIDPKVPTVDLNLSISDFDISEMYKSFSVVKQMIPIAMSCNGVISSKVKFDAILDKEMSPIANTITGEGYFASKGILINNNPTMNQLSTVLKKEELSRLTISKLQVDFKLKNGNITIEPFQTQLAGNPVTIFGTQSVDGAMDYTLSMNIKREHFGSDVDNLLSKIPGSNNIKSLSVDAKIGGTLDKPTVKPDLTKAIQKVTEEAAKELTNKAKDGITKGLKNLFKKK